MAARPEPGAPQPTSSSAEAAPWRFRPDVEGLRALAIVAVVGYHVGLPLFGGGFVGVDVFFVISGFLITGLLVAEAQSGGHVSLARFWARRARRLLPAATLVLAVVAVASWFALPRLDHRSVGIDVSASALYVSNLRFAAQATDYLAAEAAPSPVLHFWSLGVEEQFYLVWPLLVIAVALLARRRARRSADAAGVRRHHLALALALLGAASFLLSLRLTDRAQPWAFFGMPTRAWEFALGGLLAIGAAEVARAPALLRRSSGVVGLVVLLGSVVLVDGDAPYPGTQALWPVLGTAALILAGTTIVDREAVVPRLLSTWPMRALGRLSYSWYLWHWPALVLALAVWGTLPTAVLLAVALLALVPATLSYRFLEQPVRHLPSLVASPRRSLLLGLALSTAAALCGVMLALVPGGGMVASSTPAVSSDEDTGRGRGTCRRRHRHPGDAGTARIGLPRGDDGGVAERVRSRPTRARRVTTCRRSTTTGATSRSRPRDRRSASTVTARRRRRWCCSGILMRRSGSRRSSVSPTRTAGGCWCAPSPGAPHRT